AGVGSGGGSDVGGGGPEGAAVGGDDEGIEGEAGHFGVVVGEAADPQDEVLEGFDVEVVVEQERGGLRGAYQGGGVDVGERDGAVRPVAEQRGGDAGQAVPDDRAERGVPAQFDPDGDAGRVAVRREGDPVGVQQRGHVGGGQVGA